MAYLAASLVRLRAEVNTRWPRRDKSSDGWIGDPAHATTKSEHNPDSKGCVHALDIDVTGIDRALLVRAAIAAPATWYVISNRVIYSRAYGFRGRVYTGSNPHTAHVHISINLTASSEGWRGTWLPAAPAVVAPDRDRVVRLTAVQPGMRGPDVLEVQRALNTRYPGNLLIADGVFGSKTVAKYAAHQKALGFTGADADGRPGTASLTKLGLRVT